MHVIEKRPSTHGEGEMICRSILKCSALFQKKRLVWLVQPIQRGMSTCVWGMSWEPSIRMSRLPICFLPVDNWQKLHDVCCWFACCNLPRNRSVQQAAEAVRERLDWK